VPGWGGRLAKREGFIAAMLPGMVEQGQRQAAEITEKRPPSFVP